MRATRSLFSPLALTLCFTPLALAQVSPNIENGFKAYASYDSTKLDTVNLSNGGLTLHNPLPFSYLQRGGKLNDSYFLVSNSKHWQVQYFINSNGFNYYWDYGSGPYAKYTVPLAPYLTGTFPLFLYRILTTEVDGESNVSEWDSGYYLQSWDGSVHQLLDTSGGLRTSFESSDTSGYHLVASNPDSYGTSGTFVVTDRNGNVFQGNVFHAASAPACTKVVTGGGLPGSTTDTICPQVTGFSTITDSNGNVRNTTDTLGRSFPLSSTSSSDSTGCVSSLPFAGSIFYNYTGPNGASEQIKVCYGSLTMQTNFSQSGVAQFPLGVHTSPNPASVITTMILPNNTKWTLAYDSYGEVLNVGLPTGGSISYTWTEISFPSCDTTKVSRAVASRTLHEGTNSFTSSYSWGAQQPDGTLTNSVTDPLGNDTVHVFSPIAIPCNFYETTTKNYQGTRTTGQLLRQLDTTYAGGSSFGDGTDGAGGWAVPTSIKTTDSPSGKVTLVQKTYDPGIVFGNVTSEKVYDWGSGTQGPLLRETDTTYLFQNDSRYLTANLADLPASVIVKDASATRKAETDFAYDDPARLTASAITIQHGAAPNPAPIRGNQTSVSKWLNTSANPVLSYTNWYDTGEVYQSIDPLNHAMTFAYSGAFVGAYPTTVTNALTQSSTYNYDFSTGLLTSATDLNSLPTNYSYDFMFRVSQVNRPDGGQDILTRQETTSPFTATLSTKINSTQSLVKTNVFDGLGRLKQSQLTSDPQGTVSTDTTFDALGRVHSVSNPHTSSPAPTDGITTYVYDALNRACVVTPPDGTAVSGSTCPAAQPINDLFTAYSGNTTTVNDQAGKARKSVSDGLGRLTQVFEDPAGSNYETDYTYDTLDNLLTVNQTGGSTNSANWRTRTFTYNSLSQLLTAANPESGTATYTYNPDGTLATKIAPAPNQTGAATVTSTYSYDALHRMTQKTFSDTTPVVKYGYDAIAPTGCTLPTLTIGNGIGKRTGMCDAAGAEAWSYDITAGVGWKLTDARTTNAVTKSTIVQNNLVGSPATLTYPSGRSITYAYDAAAHPVSAIDSTGPINYATAAAYAPTGALSSLTNGASVVSTLYFNNRLQPCRISVKNTGTAPSTCTDAANIGSLLDFNYNFSVGTADNGNVTAITNNRDTTRSQSFAYDSLNRISTAKTTSTTGTTCWDEAFGYDPWGNLLTIGRITGYTCSNEELLNVSATPQNRISGDTYDTAGNLTAIPAIATYTYNAENQLTATAGITYTYDGDGKRVQKSTGKLYWYGLGSDPLDETDAAGNTNNASFNEYTFFGGKRIARRDSTNAVSYYFADHLGTARIVANSSGTPVDDSDFYPFGGERVVTSSSGNSYKFTSKERDSESGLDDFGARYFGSTMGRFMSPDPPLLDQHIVDPQSWNLYSYARNNPLSYIDPTGNAVELLGDEEQRKKELAFLQKSLANDKAASNLYINEVKDGDKTRYFVGIKGDVGDFMKMGATSHDLANLVQNKNVVEFGLTSKDLSSQGGAVTYEKGEDRSTPGGNQNVRVLVNPAQADVANRVLDPNTVLGYLRFEGQNQDPRWRVNPFTGETMAWHEFGHAWAIINGRSLDRSNPEAFQWENRMREQLYGPLGPNNARRTAH